MSEWGVGVLQATHNSDQLATSWEMSTIPLVWLAEPGGCYYNFIRKDTQWWDLGENTKLPCPLPVVSGHSLSQHIKVFASQHAPLTFGVQSFYWGFLHGHHWLEYWPHHLQPSVYSPKFKGWKSQCWSYLGPNRSHLVTKTLSLRKFPEFLNLLSGTQDQAQSLYSATFIKLTTKQTLNGQLALMAKVVIDKIHLIWE